MNFDSIVERLKNRIWSPLSDEDAVDMIVKANMDGDIDDEEKYLLLNLV